MKLRSYTYKHLGYPVLVIDELFIKVDFNSCWQYKFSFSNEKYL